MTTDALGFDGKAVLVTGASSGLGAATVRRFAAGGAQVHTIDVPDGADWELIMRVSAARGFMTADSVAATICFLASDEASAVHGSIQLVDQGHLAG